MTRFFPVIVLKKQHFFFLSYLFFGLLLVGCGGDGPTKVQQYATQGILSGAISNNGKYAVIGSLLNGGSLWDIKGFKRKYSWNHKAGEMSLMRAVAISGDTKHAITTQEDTMVVWNTETGQSEKFLQTPARVLAVALSQDGKFALAGMNNWRAAYFDLTAGGTRWEFHHEAEVRAVGISADGKRAITAGDDMAAIIWDLTTGKEITRFTLKNQIKTAAISPDGKYAFATSQREDAIIWQIDSKKQQAKLAERYVNYTAATFSSNAKQLLLGTFTGKIKLVDVRSGKVLKEWQAKRRKAFGSGSSREIVAVAFGARRGTVLALTSDGMMEAFSL